MQLVDFTSSPLLFLNLTKKQWVAPDPNTTKMRSTSWLQKNPSQTFWKSVLCQ